MSDREARHIECRDAMPRCQCEGDAVHPIVDSALRARVVLVARRLAVSRRAVGGIAPGSNVVALPNHARVRLQLALQKVKESLHAREPMTKGAVRWRPRVAHLRSRIEEPLAGRYWLAPRING